jgi:hypothetical protein
VSQAMQATSSTSAADQPAVLAVRGVLYSSTQVMLVPSNNIDRCWAVPAGPATAKVCALVAIMNGQVPTTVTAALCHRLLRDCTDGQS